VLRIKENCYSEIKGAKNIRIFNENKLYLIVVFDDIAIPTAVEMIQQLPEKCIIKVYVFSEEQDPYTEDFYEVLDRIELCALPDAIYKAYQHILPKKKRKEMEEINTSLNLFN
jgi:adenine-specific DNA-methyltransferase